MGTYDERPWLALYDEGVPADLEPEFSDALAMFRAAAARAADRPLVHYFDATLTVGEVDRLSDGLACGFLDLGLRRGDRVALFLQNVPQFVLAALATWKAGGVVVPVNPMYKARELGHVLADSGASVLVGLESLCAEVADDALAHAGAAVRAVVTTSELDFLDGRTPPLLAASRRQRGAGTTDLVELARRHEGEVPPAVALGPADGESMR